MGGVALDDLPGHFIDHAAMGVVSGANVTGPASSTDNAIARFDGTSGQLLQDSNAIIDDAGAVSIQQGLIVGADTGTQTNLTIAHKSGGPPARRAGAIEWLNNAGVSTAFAFITGGKWSLDTEEFSGGGTQQFVVDMTSGQLTATGGINWSNGDIDGIKISDTTVGPVMTLDHTRATPAIGDRYFSFKGQQNNSNRAFFAFQTRTTATGADEFDMAPSDDILAAVISDTVNSFSIGAGTRFELDAILSSGAGVITTQGDTYLVYDSGNATLDCFVDATEVWNASTTKLNIIPVTSINENLDVGGWDNYLYGLMTG